VETAFCRYDRPGRYNYDERGRKQRAYEGTRDGFMFLGMGYTGPTAARMKEGFIAAFNGMETALRQRETALTAAARAELLRANPVWARIVRYVGLGLSRAEVVALVGLGKEAVRQNMRRMEACGVLTPPPNLAQMQAAAQRLIGSVA
jgi:hypothetical protein